MCAERCVWVCEFVCFKYIDKGGGARRRMEHFSLMHHAARPCELASHVSATHIRPEYFIRVMFFSLNVYPKLLAGSSPSEPLYQLCFFKCFFFFVLFFLIHASMTIFPSCLPHHFSYASLLHCKISSHNSSFDVFATFFAIQRHFIINMMPRSLEQMLYQ